MSLFDKVMYWIGLIMTVYATVVGAILVLGVLREELKFRRRIKKNDHRTE